MCCQRRILDAPVAVYLLEKLNFWPPILASYINPPFVMAKVAMPL